MLNAAKYSLSNHSTIFYSSVAHSLEVHCAQLRKLLLLPTISKPSEREAELSTCNFSELYDFIDAFYTKVDCKLLISGNTSKDEATTWVSGSLAKQLTVEKVDVPDWDVVELEPGTAAVWLEPGVDTTQSNSAIEIYFQLPNRDTWAWNKDCAELSNRKDVMNLIIRISWDLELCGVSRTKQLLFIVSLCCLVFCFIFFCYFASLGCFGYVMLFCLISCVIYVLVLLVFV